MGDFKPKLQFHANTHPGYIRSLKEEITISFDSPESAKDVQIAILEADEWNTGQRQVIEGYGSYTLIAIFKGEIVDYKFKGNWTLQGDGSRKLLVRFDGDPKLYDPRITAREGENEAGMLEVVFYVKGTINGIVSMYTSPSPLFVRNTVEDRPVVSFITDLDSSHPGASGQYFGSAARYYRFLGDDVVDAANGNRPISLENIFDNLRGRNGLQGQVYIVTHGWEARWYIRAHVGTEDKEEVEAKDLDIMIKDPRYPGYKPLNAPPSPVIDKDTQIILAGCKLGTDQDFLDKVAKLFAQTVGEVTILAPKYMEYYGPNPYAPGDTTPHEYLEESWVLYFRGRKTTITLDECRTEIRKNPENSNKDLSRIQIYERDIQTDERKYTRENFFHGDLDGNKINDELIQYARDNDDEMPKEPEWAWTVTNKTTNPHNRSELTGYTLTGNRTGVLVYQLLAKQRRKSDGTPVTDPAGRPIWDPVIPDINNPDHYGRSPAW